MARIFARHLHALDPATQIPPADLMPQRYRRIAPHLFTPEEITSLMAAAAALRHPLRALNYTTLIGLLAVTGMRVGEACRLDRTDIDWDAGVLTIRAGKLGKAREVPVHPSTARALHAYDERRDQLQPVTRTPAFFVNTHGSRLDAHHVSETFAQLRDAAGIRPATGGRKPRIHDLRHTFCLATMLDWYRAGADIQAQLPLLSTYLGHVDPVSTYWYLQAAPELLTLAAGRLDAFLGELP
ncbi:tyrosine-type recombinase/integrase [Streptomyces sp. NPDC051677]|uniref:tyrosine-type recombinase/integrase n=1 Tax=Streptomyces sp. NPDC051677 TaxID=3365669 RepID=UPI0037D6C621